MIYKAIQVLYTNRWTESLVTSEKKNIHHIVSVNGASQSCLNKGLIRRLATCGYISEHRNLFIASATGCGKTYMACSFSMEACKQYFNTKYVRLPDLLMDLEMARTDDGFHPGLFTKINCFYTNCWIYFTNRKLYPSDIFLLPYSTFLSVYYISRVNSHIVYIFLLFVNLIKMSDFALHFMWIFFYS